ncbi:TPA: hypothetical protein HA251_00630 [Candidatus Woesearchaeota archaeon]|nr:hypothetical protein [Candidatus Woesearchaeota archaeon]
MRRMEKVAEGVKEYSGALVFNPMVWGFSAALGVMLAAEPKMLDETLLPSVGAVAIVGVGGLLRYRHLKEKLGDDPRWSTDLFRRHRAWTVYAWADAHGQRPEYHRWKQMYETQCHYGERGDEF